MHENECFYCGKYIIGYKHKIEGKRAFYFVCEQCYKPKEGRTTWFYKPTTLDTVLKEYGPERFNQLVHDYLLDLRFGIQPLGEKLPLINGKVSEIVIMEVGLVEGKEAISGSEKAVSSTIQVLKR